MNKLKAALPQHKDEILEFVFRGNIADSKKFITDGHVMFLASAVPEGMEFDDDHSFFSKSVSEKRIQESWDTAEKEEQVPAHFIGCGMRDTLEVVAVLRDDRGRFTVFNPNILKLTLMATQADSLGTSSSDDYYKKMTVFFRDGKMVGAAMGMRYAVSNRADFDSDLKDYDLTGPAIPLSEV